MVVVFKNEMCDFCCKPLEEQNKLLLIEPFQVWTELSHESYVT